MFTKEASPPLSDPLSSLSGGFNAAGLILSPRELSPSSSESDPITFGRRTLLRTVFPSCFLGPSDGDPLLSSSPDELSLSTTMRGCWGRGGDLSGRWDDDCCCCRWRIRSARQSRGLSVSLSGTEAAAPGRVRAGAAPEDGAGAVRRRTRCNRVSSGDSHSLLSVREKEKKSH